MFDWNVHVSYDPSRFVITVPFHYMLLLVALPAVLGVLAVGLKAGHPWRNGAIGVALVVAIGFLGYGTELTLDKTTGKATLREFSFFHWSTQTFALSDVDRLYVTTGSTADQLRLQFNDGSVRSLSFMDQYRGKEKVAYTANRFLGDSGSGN